MIGLEDNKYGKSRVRLVRVKRRAESHDFHEWNVEILVRGDFADCFQSGDNRQILPTDTMKNTVYSLARDSVAAGVEDFAAELVDFLLRQNPQILSAEVTVEEKAWEHLALSGRPHPTTFVQTSGERQTATISRAQGGRATVVSGLENLIILKTADSGFEGFKKDSLTTLPETTDRLFGTAVRARWTYAETASDFAALRKNIRDTLLREFADHHSKSVQHTLYQMARSVLEAAQEVREIELRMPNKHCLLVDLSRFGQDNPNEIFVPVDEPHGYIEARICRKG
jgi:urate oxidase